MPNALINENSPYLLQHAHQPVDWHPWGEAALEKAEREQKPIFLSIGYAACHWCHVMAHESFENGEIAAILNQYFVNIKVDREERPDLDGIYMQAVVAMTGQGGWPMSLFLTPDGKPFYGGTYFPPVRRYNMPAFGEILLNIARLWQEDRHAILEGAGKLTAHLQGLLRVDADANVSLTRETLEEAVMEIARRYDWKHGGWGRAPKFPQPMTIEFLLQRAIRGDKLALDMAIHALNSMAKGGMYDVVAGGFARYSTDERWLVPHFEKMLYDNAQLALVYLHGWLLTGNQAFRQVCEQTLDFVARELTHPEGGFFSSLDADSEEGEGRFYTWTIAEVENVLTSVDDIEFIKAAYGLTEQGNFDGSNLLQRVMTDEELTNRFHMSLEDVHERLKVCHQKLLVDRSRRPRPGTDDKVLASWNGLMQIAFAEAARHLQRSDYLE
ncbi:MAG TPA: thioredoxin domain-containing protein, partial [Anaerolineaceae bacterium]|nr:thioredoxin domain-containing protein [Anaerolineaceae bacterium]